MIIPAGDVQLEAILRTPKNRAARGAAVLCHPHPSYGGTMDNRVVFRAGKAAIEGGFAVLKFNFRGVGASSGTFDFGVGEKKDVTAAVDWLAREYPDTTLALIGFSFGAWVGLEVGCRDPRIRILVGLGLPLNLYDFEFLVANRKPALYIVGTADEFCAPEELDGLAQKLSPSSAVHRIGGADHFFSNQLKQVEALITGFLNAQA